MNPSCGEYVEAPDKAAGKKARCPFCQTVQLVPSDGGAAPKVVLDPAKMRSRGVRHREGGGIAVGRMFGEVSRGVIGAEGRPAAAAPAVAGAAAEGGQTAVGMVPDAPEAETVVIDLHPEYKPLPEEELCKVAEVDENPPIETVIRLGSSLGGSAGSQDSPKKKISKRLLLVLAIVGAGVLIGISCWTWAALSVAAPEAPSGVAEAKNNPAKPAGGATTKPNVAKKYPYLRDDLNVQVNLPLAELLAIRSTIRLRACAPWTNGPAEWSASFGEVTIDAKAVTVVVNVSTSQATAGSLTKSQADEILILAAKAADVAKAQCPDLANGGLARSSVVPFILNVSFGARQVATWDSVARKGKVLAPIVPDPQ